jgi:uncharacterized protein YkwD
MKKKFIALIICGALACTALVGLAFQNSIESANNSKNVNKSIIESVDKENEVEQKEANKIGSYNEESGEAVGSNNDGGNENTTRLSRGGQDTNSKSNETVATNNQRNSLDKTEENSTSVGNEEKIPDNNPSNNTNRQETSTPSQGQANEPNQSMPSTTVQGDFSSQIEQFIFIKVNEERVQAGMTTLSYSGLMEKYARIKSQDMGDRNYFDHKNPEGELITAQMKRDGISYRSWGENIAYIGGVSDINELANMFMTNWMNSQGHRENILSPNFTSIGVGVYKVGNRYYATQEFYK